MSRELHKGWLSRFRSKNYQFAARICESRWFRIYFFIVVGLIFVRIAGVESNPHLFGWLLRIPEFVIVLLMWTAIYPWIILFLIPRKFR